MNRLLTRRGEPKAKLTKFPALETDTIKGIRTRVHSIHNTPVIICVVLPALEFPKAKAIRQTQ